MAARGLRIAAIVAAAALTALCATVWVRLQVLRAYPPASTKQAAHAPGPAEALTDGCYQLMMGMSDCKFFVLVGSKMKHPDELCCEEVAAVFRSDPLCLCQLVSGAVQHYGLVLNTTRMIELYSICHLVGPPMSECAHYGFPIPMGGAATAPATRSPQLM